MIKPIISSLAVLFLSGCVYYVPYEVAATEPWVDEPVVYQEPVVAYESYVVSPYYPWGSVDYFYLGNNYYWPTSHISFSLGFYGGGGWYPSYYGPFYYSAWYQPFYGFPYPCPYPYAYAHSGAGYDYWEQRYPSRSYHPSHGDHDGNQGSGQGGGHNGGRGGQGNASYGNSGNEGIRSGEYRSLDRHVQTQRQPGQFNRNVSAAPSANAADQGLTVTRQDNNKIKPSRLQPVGNKNHYGGSSPDEPIDLSGFAGQNKVAPSRTGMPAGPSRPAPPVDSSSRQFVAQQVSAEPAQVPQSAPQPPPSQQIVPQTQPTRSGSDYSRQPTGNLERGQSRPDDTGDGVRHRDRDDH